MKPFVIGIALLVQALLAPAAMAADFFVYPVKASLTIREAEFDFDLERDVLTEVKLKESDVVNLALGRALTTKVDKKTEILALATAFEGTTNTPLSKLIVFDPTKTGPARITRTVALAKTIDVESTAVPGAVEGQGIATADMQENGDASYALHLTTFFVTGSGKTSPTVPPGADGKITWKGTVAGRISLTKTDGGNTTTLSGFAIKGKVAATGKSIGQFSE